MRRSSRLWTACALSTSLMVLASGAVPAAQQESPAKTRKAKAERPAERASGVIIKVEPIDVASSSRSSTEKGKAGRRESTHSLRLTINTAALWSDWARDQATENGGATPKKAAERGANSVATRGEPVSKDTVTMIHLDPRSKVETRFRSPEDETSKGEKTPAEARREDSADTAKDSAATTSSSSKSSPGAKPIQFKASDLRPGLFVEVDFRHMKSGNLATTVAVIRPVSRTLPGEKSGDR